MALTDHDGVAGFPEAQGAASQGAPSSGTGPRLLCGIEISTNDGEVHILGYGMELSRPCFVDRVSGLRRSRRERVSLMVEKLQGKGFAVSLEEVESCCQGVIGRPHIADVLCRKGLAGSRAEAFGRWLAEGRPGYVPSLGPSPEEAIGIIREAGGFAVLAHPDTVADLAVVGEWVRKGLEGMEAHYPTYPARTVARFAKLAADHGLLLTGGSDYHGPGTSRDTALGLEVPGPLMERFLERLARCG